jgi:hypothetical protein
VGKAVFAKTMWLEEGMTLAQVKPNGDGYLVLLVTPRILLVPQVEVAAPADESHRAAPPAATERLEGKEDK